eukprot:6456291-Amphidinium_carterae.1
MESVGEIKIIGPADKIAALGPSGRRQATCSGRLPSDVQRKRAFSFALWACFWRFDQALRLALSTCSVPSSLLFLSFLFRAALAACLASSAACVLAMATSFFVRLSLCLLLVGQLEKLLLRRALG